MLWHNPSNPILVPPIFISSYTLILILNQFNWIGQYWPWYYCASLLNHKLKCIFLLLDQLDVLVQVMYPSIRCVSCPCAPVCVFRLWVWGAEWRHVWVGSSQRSLQHQTVRAHWVLPAAAAAPQQRQQVGQQHSLLS